MEDSRLDYYTKYNENQLVHINEPGLGVFIAESPNVIERAINGGYEPISILTGHSQMQDDNRIRILIEETILPKHPLTDIIIAEDAVLSQLPGFEMTRGVLCAMKRKPPLPINSVLENATRVAVLEDIINPTNVGAIFRSAAALNMDAVLLTSACADPLYKRAARVSMGTVFQIPWTYIEDSDEIKAIQKQVKVRPARHDYIKVLKNKGFKTVSMALKDDSLSLRDPLIKNTEKLAVILGTESEGLCDDTLNMCDYTVMIPMSHNVDSLNVAAASAVAFWELGKH